MEYHCSYTPETWISYKPYIIYHEPYNLLVKFYSVCIYIEIYYIFTLKKLLFQFHPLYFDGDLKIIYQAKNVFIPFSFPKRFCKYLKNI